MFRLMQAYNMKLNLAKCVFGVSARKFLGFMVTQRGIKVNPAQIKAVLETPGPNSKKELQCLTRHLAALGRFISPFHKQVKDIFSLCSGEQACSVGQMSANRHLK